MPGKYGKKHRHYRYCDYYDYDLNLKHRYTFSIKSLKNSIWKTKQL